MKADNSGLTHTDFITFLAVLLEVSGHDTSFPLPSIQHNRGYDDLYSGHNWPSRWRFCQSPCTWCIASCRILYNRCTSRLSCCCILLTGSRIFSFGLHSWHPSKKKKKMMMRKRSGRLMSCQLIGRRPSRLPPSLVERPRHPLGRPGSQRSRIPLQQGFWVCLHPDIFFLMN